MLLARTALRARPMRGVRARALGDLCTDMVTEDAASKYAQAHARSLAGGRAGDIPGERLVRIEFPENAGALHDFLASLRTDWFLTMLHYRNQGGQVGKVLAGVRVPEGEEAAFKEVLEGLGHTFYDETGNQIYLDFMR